MSKRRRIGHGMYPIDRIGNTSLDSSDIDSNQAPQFTPPRKSIKKTIHAKRYTGVRRDPKVVNDIKNLITEEFLTTVPKTSTRNNRNIFTDQTSGSMITDRDIKHYDRRLISSPKSDNEIHVIDEDDDDDDDGIEPDNTFQSRHSSPEMRRPKSSGKGLLESSPSNTSIYKYSVNKMGTLKIIGNLGIRYSFEFTNLTYEFSNHDIRINFIKKRAKLFDKPISLRFDCKSLFFASKYTFFGIILKEQETFYVEDDKKNYKIRTRTLIWEDDTSTDNDTLIKMDSRRATLGIKCKTEVLNNQKEIVEKLMLTCRNNKRTQLEDTANSAVANSFQKGQVIKSNFLSKPSFNSLNSHFLSAKRKHTSATQSGTATKISIPNHNTEISGNGTGLLTRNIPAQSFYSNRPTPKNFTIDNNRIQLQVRKSSRLSNIDNPPKAYNLDSFEEDDNEPYEKPEQFKPTLHQKFPDGTSYTVTNQDFKCLYNKDWINDSIIEFFGKYYVEASISKSIIQREDVYIMSSFFYSKLTSDPNNLYGNVRKWVQNADLFNKKYIVIPMNVNYHWYGCIITNLDVYLKCVSLQQKAGKQLGNTLKDKQDTPEEENEDHKSMPSSPNSDEGNNNESTTPKETQEVDSNTEQKKEGEGIEEIEEFTDAQEEPSTIDSHDDITLSYPTIEILTFDSLRGTHTREVDPIKEFIIGYAKDKYGLAIDKSYIKMKTCLVPQQPNMSDCGVHVILTIKKFFENPIATMDIWRNAKIRGRASNKIINQYFEKAERNKKRKALREVLKDLLADQIKRTGYTSDQEHEKDEEEDDEDIEIIEDMSKQIETQKIDHETNNDTKEQLKKETKYDNQERVKDKSNKGVESNDNDEEEYKHDNKHENEQKKKQKDKQENYEKDLSFDQIQASNSKFDNGLSSDPPSSPEHQSDDLPKNSLLLDTQNENSSSSPILSPRESDDDIVIPSEAIVTTNFLESSPLKNHSLYETKKDQQPIVSRFFDQSRTSLKGEPDNHEVVPILGSSIDRVVHVPRLSLSSPNHGDESLPNDASHSVIISDNDEDVKLVEKVVDPSPFNSELQSDKRDTATIISEKVEQELNNNDIHETYHIDKNYGHGSSQESGEYPNANHSPVLIQDDQGPSPLSEAISLDDD